MKIYIIDNSFKKLQYAELYFRRCDDVVCICDEFEDFMNNHSVDCVVSPANSFGLMDGGFDLAITEYFGEQLQNRVQRYILDNYFGEQPVGTSFILDSGKHGISLIHTPTMRMPQEIKDPLVIYQCMRTTLMCAIRSGVQRILIPLFGGGCGRVHPKQIAEMMWRAYDQIKNPPQKLDWDYVEKKGILNYEQ